MIAPYIGLLAASDRMSLIIGNGEDEKVRIMDRMDYID
jgi:hypothetical protein